MQLLLLWVVKQNFWQFLRYLKVCGDICLKQNLFDFPCRQVFKYKEIGFLRFKSIRDHILTFTHQLMQLFHSQEKILILRAMTFKKGFTWEFSKKWCFIFTTTLILIYTIFLSPYLLFLLILSTAFVIMI